MLRNSPVLNKGAALGVVVRCCWVDTMATTSGTDEQFKGACVKDASNLLAPKVEVSEVLDVLKVVQLLLVADRPFLRFASRRMFKKSGTPRWRVLATLPSEQTTKSRCIIRPNLNMAGTKAASFKSGLVILYPGWL